MSIGFKEVLASINGDGTALTAAARASATQGALGTTARYTMPGNKLRVGDVISIEAGGRVSFAVTTPGTFRLDLAAGATVIFDSLAMGGNIIVQTNEPWYMKVQGIVRAVGTTGNIFWQGQVTSRAFLNTATAAVGPWTGTACVPFNTAPVVGANFDTTASSLWDLFFTQTAATGSFTLHTYSLALESSTGF